MANQIGTIQFLELQGLPDYPGETLQEITRPNVDGHAYRKTGQRGGLFAMFSVLDVTSAAAAEAHIKACAALMGTLVTVIDAVGQAWDNVAVLDVTPRRVQAVKTMVGGLNIDDGADGYLVYVRWTLQMSQVEAS